MYQEHRFDDGAERGRWPIPAGKLVERPHLPRETSAVVLFADIVGYTEHCESLDPEDAFLLLSGFYRSANRATAAHAAAIVDHFGDEVLAVWKGQSSPGRAALHALRCSFAILDEVGRWNEKRARSNLNAVKVGIGIHAGPVLLARPDEGGGGASVFGDTVNIASRLERQTRIFGADIITSNKLFDLVADAEPGAAVLDRFQSAFSVYLSGRAKPLEIRAAAYHPPPSPTNLSPRLPSVP